MDCPISRSPSRLWQNASRARGSRRDRKAERVKLAIVRQRYTPFGGAERFVERAIAGLRAAGLDVSVVSRKWQGSHQDVLCDPFYVGRTWRDAGFARCVQGLINSGRFDLVQSHERIPGCHVYRAGDGVHATWLELRAASRRAKLDPTRFSPWHRYTLAAESAMFGHPGLRAVICNSLMVRDDIARRFGLPAARLHVIHNGVDLEYFRPATRGAESQAIRRSHGVEGEGERVILFVGSGFERKGVPTLLAALAEPQCRRFRAWIVGRDKSQTDMEALARRLGVAGRVKFFGGQDDVRPFYAAADLLALPTLYDPFPNVIVEALASGLPVVTTTTSGGAELVGADNGEVVPAGAPAELAAALARVAERLPRAKEAARASVEHLGIEDMAAKLSALYRDLVLDERSVDEKGIRPL